MIYEVIFSERMTVFEAEKLYSQSYQIVSWSEI